MQRIAIGDIHGCHRSLQTMLDVVQPAADDLIVTLGDYDLCLRRWLAQRTGYRYREDLADKRIWAKS